jgi:hypothetical protein
VRGEEIITVTSFAQLRQLLAEWDGTPPAPRRLYEAHQQAEQAARARVEALRDAAARKEEANLRRQVEAARRRLLRELARTLRCLDTGDLNHVLRRQVEREVQPDGRYHRALRLLGGYPAWTREEIDDAEAYVNSLKEADKLARRAGSALDAALNDPRWLAREAAGRATAREAEQSRGR